VIAVIAVDVMTDAEIGLVVSGLAIVTLNASVDSISGFFWEFRGKGRN
jgi:hypothetical protein